MPDWMITTRNDSTGVDTTTRLSGFTTLMEATDEALGSCSSGCTVTLVTLAPPAPVAPVVASPDGTEWKIAVSDTGEVQAQAVP